MKFRDRCPECGGELRFSLDDEKAIFVCVGMTSDPEGCGWSAEIPAPVWSRAAESAVVHRASA